MSLFQSSEEKTSFPKNIDVTLQKSAWERVGAFLWGVIKVIFFVSIIGLIFLGGKEGIQNESSKYSKTYYDAFYRETQANPSAAKVAVLNLSGTIIASNSYGFSTDTTLSRSFIALLAHTLEDQEISAVIIQINSPGGEVFAAEQISQSIDILSKKFNKPIYMVLESMAASGGYYIATSGKKIFAYPETLLGNIGVRVDIPNVEKLMEKVGVEMQSVTSGEMKTMGSPLKKMSEEEEKIFKALIEESFDTFVNRVATGRNMTTSEAEKLSDGRIFSGTQALDNGLIDGLIKSLTDLENEISKELDGSPVQFVLLSEKISAWDEFLLSVQNGINPLKAEISKSQKINFSME